MNATKQAPPISLKLQASAKELMIANPVSLRADATVDEAMALFVDKNIDAAPVIDTSGRPLGVLSRSDLFVHLIEQLRRHGANVSAGGTTVADLMTPTVFAVSLKTPVRQIIKDMVGLHVHRLFVVDDGGALVGVITAMDVLKLLPC